MPLYASVPLPGPFRYVKRVGGRRGGHGLLWWAFLWPIVLLGLVAKWSVIGTVWACRKTYELITNR